MNKINLWKNEPPFFNENYNNEQNEQTPTITPYLVNDNKYHSAIIICPGGGYNHRAEHEGKPIALWLNSIGIHAFVLNYRVYPYKYPAEIADGKRAVKYIKYYKEKFKIVENKIGIMGFSAGGHLACTVSQKYDKDDYIKKDEIDFISAKTDICILCYPVITFIEKYTHEGTKNCFLRESNNNLSLDFSCEKNVKENFPPTFIWHTAEDSSVPVLNSIDMARALYEKNIPFEIHIFPQGRHGLGFAEEIKGTCQWRELLKDWLERMKFYL